MPRQSRQSLQSGLARALQAVPSRVRQMAGVPDVAIDLVDLMITTLRAVVDDTDQRTLEQILQSAADRFGELFPDGPPSTERVDAFVTGFERDFQPRLQSMLKSDASRRFWLKLLGTRTFSRLRDGLRQDGVLLLVAARRFVRWGLPIATALDDCAAVLSDDVRRELFSISETEHVLLQAALRLDEWFDQVAERQDLHFDHLPVRAGEERAANLSLEAAVDMARLALESDALRHVADLSETLSRKLRGYNDALTNSADGVSQAANSLVEFIDRLLRESFDESFVLEWIDQHFPGARELTYDDHGIRRPTKRGQALCFVAAGNAVEGDAKMERMLAASLATVRRRSEAIKHSDDGTPEQAAELRELMNAARGYFTVAVKVGWSLDADRLAALRRRLTPAV